MRYVIGAYLLSFQSAPIRHKNVYIALHKRFEGVENQAFITRQLPLKNSSGEPK
jgi:hypothetical protein